VKFQWNAECENAFKELKDKLVSASVLSPPDLTKQCLNRLIMMVENTP